MITERGSKAYFDNDVCVQVSSNARESRMINIGEKLWLSRRPGRATDLMNSSLHLNPPTGERLHVVLFELVECDRGVISPGGVVLALSTSWRAPACRGWSTAEVICLSVVDGPSPFVIVAH